MSKTGEQIRCQVGVAFVQIVDGVLNLIKGVTELIEHKKGKKDEVIKVVDTKEKPVQTANPKGRKVSKPKPVKEEPVKEEPTEVCAEEEVDYKTLRQECVTLIHDLNKTKGIESVKSFFSNKCGGVKLRDLADSGLAEFKKQIQEELK